MAETEANKRQKCDQIALVKVLAANVGDRSMTYSGRPSVPEELQRTGGKTVLCGHANEIVPGLYLGSEQASAAPMKAALQELNVRTVVNCTFEPGLEPGLACASVFEGRRINYVRVAVRDEDSANILPYLPGAADLIQQQLQAGNSVLVHCQRGVSRSATVVIAFLIRHRGMSRDDAYVLAKGRRSHVSPNIGFWAQLKEFERSCRTTSDGVVAPTIFNEDWARGSLAAWSIAPTSHAFADVVAMEGDKSEEDVAALVERRKRAALGAGLELCLSRASCASGCEPSDVRWLCALCRACGGGGGGLAQGAVRQLREYWEAELRENWESDFSHDKFESLLAELTTSADHQV